MNRTLVSALLMLVAAAAPAAAAPVLRGDVRVNAEVVTVGDMFDDADMYAEQPLFRAPSPGTTGTVAVDAVRQAAKLIGLTDFDASGVVTVQVSRDAVTIDEQALTDLITADLTKRGIVAEGVEAVATFDQRNLNLQAAAEDNPVSLESLRYMPGTGVFSARFALAGVSKPIDLSGRIDLMVLAPHLAQTMKAGAVLEQTDIEMKLIPLKAAEAGGAAELNELIGKALQRQARAGVLLKPSDVTEPAVITRSDAVTIYFRNGPMVLTVKGQAISSASIGQPIQVLNLMSKKVLTGTATGPGAVELTPSPQQVAGL